MHGNRSVSQSDALLPTAAEQGVEIVTVEIAGARKAPTIKVYIDTPSGVSFDELAQAQVWVNEIMDRIDPFPGAYTLEVSSPGIDRPLRTPEHFSRFAGEKVRIVCKSPVDGRSKFTGKLEGCEDGIVTLEVDGAPVALEFGNLKRARIQGSVDFSR